VAALNGDRLSETEEGLVHGEKLDEAARTECAHYYEGCQVRGVRGAIFS